ncbi:hypothetical protein AB1N83_005843 [Pleurotus pulmonarius]
MGVTVPSEAHLSCHSHCPLLSRPWLQAARESRPCSDITPPLSVKARTHFSTIVDMHLDCGSSRSGIRSFY